MEEGKGLQRIESVFSSPLPQGPAQPTQVLCLSQHPGNSQPPWIKAVLCADSVVRLSGFKSLCTHSLALCTWAGDVPLLAYFLTCKMAMILEPSEGINKNGVVNKVKNIKPLELNPAQGECLIKGALGSCTFFFFLTSCIGLQCDSWVGHLISPGQPYKTKGILLGKKKQVLVKTVHT